MKYLFIAQYKDGSQYDQSLDDCSKLGNNTSSFGDVRKDEVARFHLQGGGHIYTVDLSDGHFEIDGVPFRMHDDEVTDLELVYFRRHWVTFSQDTYKEESRRTVFFFGWSDASGRKTIMQVE
jgi:hypothetical protein